MIEFDNVDLENFELCIWKEARGEHAEGMQAVGHVIVNRVGTPGFAHTLHDVIYGRNQFTSMSVSSDPEYNLEPKPGDPQYAYVCSVSSQILRGIDADVTHGARYYDVAGTKNGWFTRVISGPDEMGTPNHPFTVQIGHQRFYV